MDRSLISNEKIKQDLADVGFVFLTAVSGRALLESSGSLSDWAAFAASWDRLAPDTYMADKGRYRRRRHAVFAVSGDAIERSPHQPHFQSVDYNPLNGGVERWFEPIEDAIARGQTLQTILSFCRATFGRIAPAVSNWRVEIHQFRIEARAGEAGRPTPEGMHRDGVDFVLVLMVRRRNIASGTTLIRDVKTGNESKFTLTEPLDAVLLSDARVTHAVTPVEPLDNALPAYRDVLVVTFRSVSA